MNQLRGWIAAATESITTVAASPGSATNIGSFDGVAALKAVGVTPTLYKRCQVCDHLLVHPQKRYCSGRCRRIIDLEICRRYFCDGLTLREVAADVGVSLAHVRQSISMVIRAASLDPPDYGMGHRGIETWNERREKHRRATNLSTMDRGPIIEYLNDLHHRQ
jgi:AraC-like DNA-binding protein